MARAQKAEAAAPVLVTVLMLRTVEGRVGERHVGAAIGREAQLERGAAALWCLLGWCEPVEWRPTRAELSAAVPGALAWHEEQRRGRGQDEAGYWGVPTHRRFLEQADELTRAAGGPEEAA